MAVLLHRSHQSQHRISGSVPKLLNPSNCDSIRCSCLALGTKYLCLLQDVTASSELPTYPRLMSEAEQTKVLQACRLLQVDVSISPSATLTNISLKGTVERVHRVSMHIAMCAVHAVLCCACCDSLKTAADQSNASNRQIELCQCVAKPQRRPKHEDVKIRCHTHAALHGS